MEQIPMRDGYGKALLELCKIDKNVLVLDADVAKSTRADWIKQQFPNHFIDMGISEQDMVGTAAGMALAGMIPFVSTYGVFLSGRAWDQIRNTVCYNNLNVKLGGAHAGISVGPDGATHQALEDVAIMRVLPNMTVVVPCDSIETYKATMAIYHTAGPCYIRFGREAVPVITTDATPFVLGKACVFRPGSDVTIFANGTMVHQSMNASNQLQKKGISARVVNVHTVKPLDAETILSCAAETGAVVVAEEHQQAGGLGGAICELLSQHTNVPVCLVGIHDTFGESGNPCELMENYGLGIQNVVDAAVNVLKRK